MTTTKKYNNANELEELKKEKLLIGNNLYLTALSKKFFIVYSFVIPKEKVIKDYNIEEAFKLAISLIKEPFVENKKFNLEKFNYEKDYFVEGNRQSMENKINQMYEEFYKIIDKKEELGCSYEKSAKYLEQIKKRLDDVEVEELTMSDKALEELLIKNVYTPYPLVKYTERPDTFASHLYQGM